MDFIDRAFDLLLRRHPRAGYAAALCLSAAAIALRLAFPALRYPFLMLMPAVLVGGLVGGWRPGTLAACLALGLAWYLPGAAGVTGSLAGMLIAAGVFAVQILCIEAVRVAARRAEARRRRADELLAENDVMFRELQHRVANNMQFIASLLCLQGLRLPEGDLGRLAMTEASDRLLRFATIHRRLHDAHCGQDGFAPLIEDILTELLLATDCPHVALTVRAPDTPLPLDLLTTLILITTEAATNAAKHVFAPGLGHRLIVTLEPVGTGEMALAIADDGPGFPPGFAADTGSRLGFKIVRSLATRLGGELCPENAGGAVLRVRFPAPPLAPEPEAAGLGFAWRRVAGLATLSPTLQ